MTNNKIDYEPLFAMGFTRSQIDKVCQSAQNLEQAVEMLMSPTSTPTVPSNGQNAFSAELEERRLAEDLAAMAIASGVCTPLVAGTRVMNALSQLKATYGESLSGNEVLEKGFSLLQESSSPSPSLSSPSLSSPSRSSPSPSSLSPSPSSLHFAPLSFASETPSAPTAFDLSPPQRLTPNDDDMMQVLIREQLSETLGSKTRALTASDQRASALIQEGLDALSSGKLGTIRTTFDEASLKVTEDAVFQFILDRFNQSQDTRPSGNSSQSQQQQAGRTRSSDYELLMREQLEENLREKTMALTNSVTMTETLVQFALDSLASSSSSSPSSSSSNSDLESREKNAFRLILDKYNQNPTNEPELEDPILGVTVPLSEMMTVNCRRWHSFSVESLWHALKAADYIPVCPHANNPNATERCDYALTLGEVEQVINEYERIVCKGSDGNGSFETEDKTLLRLVQGHLVQGGNGWTSEKFATLYLRKANLDMGCVECPSPDCGTFVQVDSDGYRQRIACAKCKFVFCSSCKRQYHYRCECDEVMTIHRGYLDWQQTGRLQFLERMAKDNQDYQKSLEEFTKKKKDFEEEEKAWGILKTDETYKQSNCKLCPHCNRVIQRLSGCDSMRCGQDTSGGNVQNGCGKSFNWRSAPEYKPDLGNRSNVRRFDAAEPQKASEYVHVIEEGLPAKCDVCHEDIVGPLGMCIHCPDFQCCIKCQSGFHPPNHTFRIVTESE
eukprot:Lithocolla_globosa_v1_NODE_1274_length_2706_cov_15.631837.p1 type:complete len:726 gc:universal NODE_1274_length_2706_cov_15.631837:2453-276(-)